MPKKILIVDDDPDMRAALTMILESQDYEIVTAQNGVEGLAALKAEMPDLMLLDLLMPTMDGFGVLKELQDGRWAKYRNIPIVILSSVREEASKRRYELETALELKVDDYVEKPVAPDVLLKRVENLLKGKSKA